MQQMPRPEHQYQQWQRWAHPRPRGGLYDPEHSQAVSASVHNRFPLSPMYPTVHHSPKSCPPAPRRTDTTPSIEAADREPGGTPALSVTAAQLIDAHRHCHYSPPFYSHSRSSIPRYSPIPSRPRFRSEPIGPPEGRSGCELRASASTSTPSSPELRTVTVRGCPSLRHAILEVHTVFWIDPPRGAKATTTPCIGAVATSPPPGGGGPDSVPSSPFLGSATQRCHPACDHGERERERDRAGSARREPLLRSPIRQAPVVPETRGTQNFAKSKSKLQSKTTRWVAFCWECLIWKSEQPTCRPPTRDARVLSPSHESRATVPERKYSPRVSQPPYCQVSGSLRPQGAGVRAEGSLRISGSPSRSCHSGASPAHYQRGTVRDTTKGFIRA